MGEYLAKITDGELKISKGMINGLCQEFPADETTRNAWCMYFAILRIVGYNIYKRLIRYRDSHLLFLHDVRVLTNNNLRERKGHVFKRKQRQVMAFRSFEGLVYLYNSLSMFDLLRARGDNLFRSIADILD